MIVFPSLSSGLPRKQSQNFGQTRLPRANHFGDPYQMATGYPAGPHLHLTLDMCDSKPLSQTSAAILLSAAAIAVRAYA